MHDIFKTSFLSFTVLDNKLNDLFHFLQTDYSQELKSEKFKLTKRDINTNEIISSRMKGGAHLGKAIFFESLLLKSKTIMLSNSYDGWITLANHISSKTNSGHITFFITFDEKKENDAQYMFVNKISEEEERVVYSMKEESRWLFFQDGKPQSFENIEHYRKRRIKERLNVAILVDYCQKLGLDIMNDSFWISDKDALYLEEMILNRSR